MKRIFAFAILGLCLFGIAHSLNGAHADSWSPVVTPADLDALIASEEPVVVDIRSADAFRAGHVPGAVSAPYATWRGPRDNPGAMLSDSALTARLQSLGLNPRSSVVIAYNGESPTDFGAAARVYWTLKSAGLTRLAILNGGMKSWTGAGKAVSTKAVAVTPSEATFTFADTWTITRDQIGDVVDGKREAVLVDARPMAFWKGRQKHTLAGKAGTLPSSLQLTHDTWFVEAKGEIGPAEQIIALAKEAGYRQGQDHELVSFCNTGHWAATNWFALSELAGVDNVRLYPESMVGWTQSDGRVVEGR